MKKTQVFLFEHRKKSVFGVFQQVQHKPGFIAIEECYEA